MPDALPRFARKLSRSEETAIVAALGDLEPVDHRLFSGVVKPSQFPRVSRIFLRLVGGHYGDFRDWPAIEGWADEIAGHLHQPPPPPEAGTPPAGPVTPDLGDLSSPAHH
jgi:menaquinone-dependent protoporphyrinogen oxidase